MATRIALLGDKDLTFLTHRALDAAAGLLPDGVTAEWVGTDTPAARALDGFDGVWALPGTPYRDDAAALAAICGGAPFTGFHFCNYGLSDGAVKRLEAAGAVIAAHAPDAGVEAFEVPAHPFFVATLFQPQMGALDGELHPLITAFAEEAARVRMVG